MINNYNPAEIEKFVQKYWKKNNTFQVTEDQKKEKYYCLSMLPYPSGNLHMGHVRNYTISDVISRYQRMIGKNVLQPIGWDAFGLPAEEAAIQNKINPADWTKKNIQSMKKQLLLLGFSYDWNREINTSNPEYYRWEQWIFKKLYQKKIAYKKTALVNWCPNDNTVLANEQVIDKKCWRCNSLVTQKNISQWFLKITHYAEELLNHLDKLTGWPKDVKQMQKNWIGKSQIIEINVFVSHNNEKLKVYTNRLDYLMGATFIAISTCHPLSKKLKKINKNINFFLKNSCSNLDYASNQKEFNKKGINTNQFIIHPLTNHLIPIWIANFVLKEYSVNSIICTPAHNQTEWAFAKENKILIKSVILDINNENPDITQKATINTGILYNSQQYNGLNNKTACAVIFQTLKNKKIAKKKIIFKIKDWGVSRQRYWGTPIPMAISEDGTIHTIPDDQLPVMFPKIKYTNQIKNKLKPYKLSEWKKILINNNQALRETNTFDTFIESSWYYARYTSPHDQKYMINPIAEKYWLPVDQYIGGIEHATMHLIYFRFYHKLLRDFGLVTSDEPVKNLLCQGMVLSDAFYYFDDNNKKIWISPNQLKIEKDKKEKIIQITHKNKKQIVHAGMIKMSKSKKNGVEPEKIIHQYGADTLRLFIMFAAPIEMSLEWKEPGINGLHRFLKKLWKLTHDYINLKNIYINLNWNNLNDFQKKIKIKINQTIIKVTDDIDRRKIFNTAIAEIMKLVNILTKIPLIEKQNKNLMYYALINIIKMLYPFTPHICFIMWKKITGKYDIDNHRWPNTKNLIIKNNNYSIIFQVNGKTRQIINVDQENITQEKIISIAINEPKIKQQIESYNIKKIIYIKNKLLNIVLIKK
ncbi:Leucine--tRNA ligase [Buchnera aphidicola (Eriosoma grossulariae)]|uniref:leucine--tRNA ligase n=1 Tax=Buchnera aphidicola TaxID=9 RepID=UPI0034644486